MSNVQVKKAYTELYQLMLANPKKQIGTLMPEFLAIMQAKSSGGANGVSFIKDANDEVTHVFCYYHKKWEPVDQVAYGAKKGTATGLNTMCKEGVSRWTKQQRTKKAQEASLLTQVAAGDIEVSDINEHQARIAEEASVIVPREDGIGFDEII